MKFVFALIAFVLVSGSLFATEPVWRVLKSDDTTAAEVLDDGQLTAESLKISGAAVAAPTNTASAGLSITVNGTNYVIALYPN